MFPATPGANAPRRAGPGPGARPLGHRRAAPERTAGRGLLAVAEGSAGCTAPDMRGRRAPYDWARRPRLRLADAAPAVTGPRLAMPP